MEKCLKSNRDKNQIQCVHATGWVTKCRKIKNDVCGRGLQIFSVQRWQQWSSVEFCNENKIKYITISIKNLSLITVGIMSVVQGYTSRISYSNIEVLLNT